jgi:hypothetical protein
VWPNKYKFYSLWFDLIGVQTHECTIYCTRGEHAIIYHGISIAPLSDRCGFIFRKILHQNSYVVLPITNWNLVRHMSIRRRLFRLFTIIIQLSVLVYYKANLMIILSKINLFSPWYSWNTDESGVKLIIPPQITFLSINASLGY